MFGLVVGRRYWRRSDADYCKRRQSELLYDDVVVADTSFGLQARISTWLRRYCSTHAFISSVAYRQVIGAELDVVSSSADVTAMT